ncbi:MAG: D-alanyl-D-alanine carboxypeptidase [Firmicutes bacterium]|nr:D-alanyl-D-alanine carboxypeptidase [Bacillota bacterium]
MKMEDGSRRKKWAAGIVLAVLVIGVFGCNIHQRQKTADRMMSSPVNAEVRADDRKEEKSTTSQLYARAAVLMDADNGRILLGKNEDEALPMASTTKIMTCILALEKGDTEDVAEVSAYGAGQPKVHMGAKKGESYRIGDLLYALMLESYNDAAVIIAEYYGSQMAGLSGDIASHSAAESKRAVLAFTAEMTKKAKELGCKDTFFVTPNGLDGSLELKKSGESINYEHHTTAADLAAVMSYCIAKSPKKEAFLKITRTPSYTFHDRKRMESGWQEGSRTVACMNHNAFLQMMDGALSGKTGFTGKAGYCYVGALEKDKKRFTIALLACGWPNNKSWKWHDARLLYEYGLEHYDRRDIREERILPDVRVKNGQRDSAGLECQEETIDLLLSREDEIKVEWDVPKSLTAPVVKGEQVGRVAYFVNGELYREFPVTAAENVPEITYFYCIIRIIRNIFL